MMTYAVMTICLSLVKEYAVNAPFSVVLHRFLLLMSSLLSFLLLTYMITDT